MKLSSLYKPAFWSAVGFIFSKGGWLLTISIVSSFLSIDDFARFNIFLLVINVFAGVIGLSMSLTANRYATERDNVATILFLTIFVSIVSFIIFLLTEEFLFNLSLGLIELCLASFIILLATYSNSFSGFLYASGKFKEYAKVYAGQGALMVVFSYIIGRSLNLKGVLLGLLFSYLFISIYSLFFFKRSRMILKIKRDLLIRSFSKVLGPSVLSGIFFQPSLLITAILIDNYANDKGVIAYTVANQFRMVLGFLPAILSSIFLKLLVENVDKDDDKVERINYSFSYYPIMLLSTLILVFNNVITLFVDHLNDNEFRVCLIFFLSGSVVTSFKGAISRKFISNEKGKISIISNFTWFVCFLFFSIILIPNYGSKGAAFSFLLAQVLHLIAWTPFYIKHKFYHMEFFDLKFYFSIPIYVLILVSVYLKYFILVPSLFFVIGYFLYREILILRNDYK